MNLSENDLVVYDFIRNRVKSGKKVTIQNVAERLNVSRSTVYRLAIKLGYKNWSDFIDQMTRYFLPDEKDEPRTSSQLERSLDIMAAALERHLNRIILIESCGDAEVCEAYLMTRLTELGAVALPYSAETARTHANLQEPGMALIINETGVMLWECCRICAQEGYEVVAITAHDDSPVAKTANWSIAIKDNKSTIAAYEANYFAAGTIAFMERAIAKMIRKAI